MESNDFKLVVPDCDEPSDQPVSVPPSTGSAPVTQPLDSEPSPLFESPDATEDKPATEPAPVNEPASEPAPAPEAAAEPQPACNVSEIERKLDELMEKFDRKIAVDAQKDALFDKMYAELAKYKTDIYAKLLKPLILNVSSMLDEANAFNERIRTEEPDPARMKKYIANIAMDLEEMLETNGVEIYEDESEVFNPSTQRVVGQTVTDKPELDNHIEARRRKGYRWNGVILRPEMVTIFKFKQN